MRGGGEGAGAVAPGDADPDEPVVRYALGREDFEAALGAAIQPQLKWHRALVAAFLFLGCWFVGHAVVVIATRGDVGVRVAALGLVAFGAVVMTFAVVPGRWLRRRAKWPRLDLAVRPATAGIVVEHGDRVVTLPWPTITRIDEVGGRTIVALDGAALAVPGTASGGDEVASRFRERALELWTASREPSPALGGVAFPLTRNDLKALRAAAERTRGFQGALAPMTVGTLAAIAFPLALMGGPGEDWSIVRAVLACALVPLLFVAARREVEGRWLAPRVEMAVREAGLVVTPGAWAWVPERAPWLAAGRPLDPLAATAAESLAEGVLALEPRGPLLVPWSRILAIDESPTHVSVLLPKTGVAIPKSVLGEGAEAFVRRLREGWRRVSGGR